MNSATKEILWEAVRNLPRFIFHLLWFSKNSPLDANLQQLRNSVLSLPETERLNYSREIEFVRNLPLDRIHEIIFPYFARSPLPDLEKQVVSGRLKGLPYIEHKGKNLFFPRDFTEEKARETYSGLVYIEGLTGEGKKEKSPHCYQTAEFRVEEGDVLLDVGSAEALFALDNIERVKEAYVFECAARWRKPLFATFQRYVGKTRIIPKIVSGNTGKGMITLQDAIKEGKGDRYFVKMDIEGGERDVIRGNVDFLCRNKVKLSCCVYHRQDDAEVIERMLTDIGFSISFSDGFMLPSMNGIHYPYFRHGVIYARNY